MYAMAMHRECHAAEHREANCGGNGQQVPCDLRLRDQVQLLDRELPAHGLEL